MPELDPDSFGGLLEIDDAGNIVDYDGYILAKRFDDESITWIDSRGKDSRIRRKLSEIVNTKAVPGELHAYTIEYDDGSEVTYYGEKNNPDAEKPIPVRYGGKIHDMNSVLRYSRENLEDYLWTDYLSGDNYIDIAMIGKDSRTVLTSEATVEIRQFVEERSWQMWEGKALNVTRSDVQDYLDSLAVQTVRNPFLERIEQ